MYTLYKWSVTVCSYSPWCEQPLIFSLCLMLWIWIALQLLIHIHIYAMVLQIMFCFCFNFVGLLAFSKFSCVFKYHMNEQLRNQGSLFWSLSCFSRHIWRIIWRIKTACSKSGRLCAPIRQNPAPSQLPRVKITSKRTAAQMLCPVSKTLTLPYPPACLETPSFSM